MIPRRFFWFFDLIVLTFAFWGAYLLFPQIQMLLALIVRNSRLFAALPPPLLGVARYPQLSIYCGFF